MNAHDHYYQRPPLDTNLSVLPSSIPHNLSPNTQLNIILRPVILLGQYTTSRKVAGSNPDEVIGFFN
jgi:hypothetical protein